MIPAWLSCDFILGGPYPRLQLNVQVKGFQAATACTCQQEEFKQIQPRKIQALHSEVPGPVLAKEIFGIN